LVTLGGVDAGESDDLLLATLHEHGDGVSVSNSDYFSAERTSERGLQSRY
jgi:hypothetical protein